MDLYKIEVLISILWLSKSYVRCYPSFGDEYVHIKLHVPKEAVSNVHNNLDKLEQAAHPPSPVVTEHKVIHHYHHRRRRPYLKGTSHGKSHPKHSDGIFDTLIVSEVKKPSSLDSSHLDYLNHAQEIAQHIFVLPELVKKPKTHVDTYTIIEETKKIPLKPIEETHKVIESKVPAQRPHHHVQKYKIIEPKTKSKPPSTYHSHHPPGSHYHENNRPHIDTVRIIEHAQDEHLSIDYNPKRPNYERPVKFISHHQHYEARPESIAPNCDSYHVAHNYHTKTHTEARPEGGYHYKKPAIEFHDDYTHQHDTYKAPIKSTYENDNSYSPLDDLVPPSNGESSYYSSYQNKALDGIGQIRVENDSYNYQAPSFNNLAGKIGGYSYPTSYSVVETYNGVDSYSAPHVQGVDNGGYQYLNK